MLSMKLKNVLIIMFCGFCVNVFAQESTDSLESVKLTEIVVSERPVIHKSKSDVYLITTDMLRGQGNAFDIVGQLPGIVYDDLSGKISVNTDERVVMTVDGIERSIEFIKTLDPQRLKKVEVVHTPSGRYLAAGYNYVIDIRLKDDYIGHELNVQNYMMFSPAGKSGNNIINNEQPYVQYMFTNRRWRLNAGYGYADIHWGYPLTYSKTYTDKYSAKTDNYTTDNPNDRLTRYNHVANIDADYLFNDNHSLSIRTSYLHNDTHQTTEYRISDYVVTRDELTKADTRSDDVKASLIYQGAFGDSWAVYGVFSYNYLSAKMQNGYTLSPDICLDSRYKNRKDYFSGNFDLNYSILQQLAVNVGYLGVSNHYKVDDENGESVLETDENRQNIYAHMNWMPAESFNLAAGAVLEYLHRSNLHIGQTHWRVLPSLMVNYQPSRNSRISFQYKSQSEYPKLYQLTEAQTPIDDYLTNVGNPSLSPLLNHKFSLVGSFRNDLTTGVSYAYTNDFIAERYYDIADKYYQSYSNADFYSWQFFVQYNWMINENLRWKNVITLNHNKIKLGIIGNSNTNITAYSQFNYWCNPIAMLFRVEYTRGMIREPMLNGWKETGMDVVQLTMRKNFLDDRLSLSLSYVPPMGGITRKSQSAEVVTSFYRRNESLNLKCYDNMFMLRVSFRFSKGKKVHPNDVNLNFDDESKAGKGLL